MCNKYFKKRSLFHQLFFLFFKKHNNYIRNGDFGICGRLLVRKYIEIFRNFFLQDTCNRSYSCDINLTCSGETFSTSQPLIILRLVLQLMAACRRKVTEYKERTCVTNKHSYQPIYHYNFVKAIVTRIILVTQDNHFIVLTNVDQSNSRNLCVQ